MKHAKLILAALVAVLATSCGTLDPAGVYSGDKVLYEADTTIDLSYVIVNEFLLWEETNRGALEMTQPEVKLVANKIRLSYPKMIATAIALRDSYEQYPNQGTKDALMSALAVLRTATAEARKYLVKY